MTSEVRTLLSRAAEGSSRSIGSIQFPVREQWPVKRLAGVTFSDVDFNSPMVHGGLLGRIVFEGCRFHLCQWGGVNARKADFICCEFLETTFGGQTFASVSQCSFRECRFVKAEIAAGDWYQCQIQNCRFEAGEFSKTHIRKSVLDASSFTGSFYSHNFADCDLRDVDLSAAKLRDFAIVGCRQVGVRLPDRLDSFFVPPTLFAAVQEKVRGAISTEGFAIYSKFAPILGRSRFAVHVDADLFPGMSRRDEERATQVVFDQRRSIQD